MLIDYNAYKDAHLVSAFGLFLAIGSVITESSKTRWASALHGVALLVILITGFGMLGRLVSSGTFPAWAAGKLIIWFLLGASLVLARRKILPAPALIALVLVLGGAAAGLALWKP
ncbi:MAG: hypothetical protein P4M08_01085 [Oligoflexia bacterium]|nr:hypothetical protein [Oligoflexia bacterium]